MKKIHLTNGGHALIDDDDFAQVIAWKWFLKDGKYVQRTTSGKPVYLHRFILDPHGMVDHVNGNGLDNRRSNLRIATHAENAANRDKQANNTSGYKGVYFERATGKWFVRVTVLGRVYRFGTYADKELAASQYDAVVPQIFGAFARINQYESA